MYRELLDTYPEVERFAYLAKVGHKYVLSEKFNGKQYQEFLRAHPRWREFHRWVKSDAFLVSVLDALRERNIDLGYAKPPSLGRWLFKLAKQGLRGRAGTVRPRLRARFEFSMLPADGGSVIPHTDSPGKIVTLVVSMAREGEWDPAWGGGTDVNRAKDTTRSFNELNRQLDFDEVEVLDTYAFQPNQTVVFVKTFNSWHSVRPMTGPAGTMRRTLTINIEER